LKVFISSTSEDLEPHRLAAMDVIRDAQWEPLGMEHFPADPRPIVQLAAIDGLKLEALRNLRLLSKATGSRIRFRTT
jgi:hypothetical protein